MAIADYLSHLSDLRDDLKKILTEKGIDTGDNNTLSSLIPMVENVTGGSDTPIEKALYRFGVLSDVHIRADGYGGTEGDKHHSISDYERALEFYKNNGVDFICIDGDIVANSRTQYVDEQESVDEWAAEVTKFAEISNTFTAAENIPIYATTGNHDANIWGYSTSNESYGLSALVTTTDGTYNGTKTAEEIWTELVGRGIRFVFEQGDDVFIFLPMYFWNYVNMYRNGAGSEEEWIKEQLATYKDKRVFMFFHLPLNDTYDDNASGMSSTQATGRVAALRPLLNSYPNVIYFSGHSHYNLWREGGVKDDGTPYVNPNTYQSGDSMTMIHCPSCAYIRPTDDYTSEDGHGSQGLMVDVFADRVIIKGIDFTEGNGGAFIPKATYVINNTAKKEV